MEYTVAYRILQRNPIVYLTAGTLSLLSSSLTVGQLLPKARSQQCEGCLAFVVLNLSQFFGKTRPISPLRTALQSWPSGNSFARLPHWYPVTATHVTSRQSTPNHCAPSFPAQSGALPLSKEDKGFPWFLSRLCTEGVSSKSFVGVFHVLTLSRWCYIPPYGLYPLLRLPSF